MKFGHRFKETLKKEGFPPDWVESAISYSQLKKCINRLTNELAELGLEPETLRKLLKHVEDYNAANRGDDDRPLEYLLSGEQDDGESEKKPESNQLFHPKLLFYVNESTGELDSAHLNEETRHKLQLLALETGMSNVRVVEEPQPTESDIPPSSPTSGIRRRAGYRTVEVPLTSDSEFFSRLAAELSGLEDLQEREEKRMHAEIEQLGRQVARLTDPDRRASRKIINTWREIFQVYVESGIFFGTTEVDHGGHDAETAAERFQRFASIVAEKGLVDRLKGSENLRALNRFMGINREILQGLRFGEINRTAMTKILKKFDKQSGLGVRSTFPRRIEYPEFSEHLAKAVCAEVHTQILSSVPQLDDYSCPMCMDIKWRPVRLRCEHTFCIRCLIVMQTNKQHYCPLCREKTVIDACSDNLDTELAAFLKKWFPQEVKQKQRYNEHMAGVDQYGEVYTDKCCVM